MKISEDGATAFHLKKYGKYYVPGVLHANAHWPLVEDLDRMVDIANVPMQFVWQYSMSTYCSQQEMEWVRDFKKNRAEGSAGLVYLGKPTGVDNKMMAMAGALMRNFLDARYMTIQDILDQLRSGTMPEPTMVLVPNFVTFGKEKSMPDWQAQEILGWLMGRYSRSKVTVLYVASHKMVTTQWGETIANHIGSHFKGVEVV